MSVRFSGLAAQGSATEHSLPQHPRGHVTPHSTSRHGGPCADPATAPGGIVRLSNRGSCCIHTTPPGQRFYGVSPTAASAAPLDRVLL